MIYFDNAATTYPKPEEVYTALDKANRSLAFNAGRGEYKQSTEAFNLIEDTRKKLAAFIGASSRDVVFTSSATEALNIIILGMGIENGDTVYVSPFEHNAVIRPLKNLQKEIAFEIRILPFNKKTWKPEMDKIANDFSLYKPKAVFISHVSNVTGYQVPYAEIFEAAAKYSPINVLDAAQSFGVLHPNNINNVNYLIFAGHKSLYASFGIAGFFKFKNDELKVVKAGGTGSNSLNPEMPAEKPYRYEAGSPNIVAIAGLNASIDWINMVDIESKETALYNYLYNKLLELDNITTYTPEGEKTFGIISINVEGYSSEDVASILNDEYDICVRAGYHCAPYVHDFIGSKDNGGTARISLNYFNTLEEIDILVEALQSL